MPVKDSFQLARAICCGLLVCCLTPTVALAQPTSADEPSRSASASDTPPVFEEPRKERLYRDVIDQLKEMKFSEKSAFADEDVDNQIDWFVVGGTLTNKRTGQLEANFNTFQGIDNVAKRIVEFQYGSYGSQVPAWRVFDRYGGSREAARAKDAIVDQFETWSAQRTAELDRQRRMAQTASRARARSRASRRGGC